MGEFDNMNMFKIHPAFAHMLETMPLDELRKYYDDGSLLVARFVEGRERRELELPTFDEMSKIYSWWAVLEMQSTLLRLVLEGLVYIDIDENEDEPVFSLSFKGKDKLLEFSNMMVINAIKELKQQKESEKKNEQKKAQEKKDGQDQQS